MQTTHRPESNRSTDLVHVRCTLRVDPIYEKDAADYTSKFQNEGHCTMLEELISKLKAYRGAINDRNHGSVSGKKTNGRTSSC